MEKDETRKKKTKHRVTCKHCGKGNLRLMPDFFCHCGHPVLICDACASVFSDDHENNKKLKLNQKLTDTFKGTELPLQDFVFYKIKK